jgi:hypothetical protein
MYTTMTKFMGISSKQITSIGFLLATLIITLMLGSLTFLINDNAASLPEVGMNVGLEGNRNIGMTEIEKMDRNVKSFVKHTQNAPAHSIKVVNS